MNPLLNLLTLSCLLVWQGVFAAPIEAHRPGGAEHIVIINSDHPLPPRVEDVLERVSLHEKHPDVYHVYNNSGFRGFAASMQSHCVDQLANMADISLVEPAVSVSSAAYPEAYSTRPDAPWGLQRISTASTVSGDSNNLDFTYSFANDQLGKGADIYIVDTGVYTQNQVFSGRAKMLWSFDGNMTDNDGHGTHVSGIAGGNILGVASNANIFGVKALDSDGGGWSSNVVAAIDHVVKFHDARKASDSTFVGSVMSMSLASSANVASMNHAIEAAIGSGVHAVVAAGNDNENACASSPSSAGGTNGAAITVGAVDMNAERASFSNYGQCVDVYAPGVSVISAWIGGPNMVKSLSGTSMATPHVTGIVAYAMANETLASDPALMKEWISMTALPLSNGILLANNGVQIEDISSQGFLGYEKVAGKPSFNTAAVGQSPPETKAKRSLSGTISGAERLNRIVGNVHAIHHV